MLIFHLVCVLQLHVALSQFPEHFDFQKEGEMVIKGEKYNVLKLSKHVVKDHFLNFMQRRDDDNTKRVFIDKNGLRHHWSGFNDDKNLRKSDGGVSSFVEDLNNSEVIISGNVEDIVDKETKIKEDRNGDDKTKVDDSGSKDEVNGDKRKPKRKQKQKQAVVDKVIMKPALRADDAGKTMAITYFYCPFFGVMSLSAFVD